MSSLFNSTTDRSANSNSKRAVESHIKKKVVSFAYPFGESMTIQTSL